VEEYKKLYKKAREETRLVYDVLENGKDVKIKVIGSILKGENNKLRLYILNRLVDSEIDIDRIDHFLRDSYYSGIKFADYKVKGLFQNLVIVPRDTKKYNKINKNIRKKIEDLKNAKEEIPKKIEDLRDAPAYLMVKEEGIEQVEYLLTAREFIFDRVLFHPKNLMLIGALNMGIRLIARYEPCITMVLPFLTDQILLQMFREDKFANTTIEGYEKILRGEIPIEEFSSNKEILLRADNREKVEEVFEIIEDYNSMSPAHPKIIMFSNLKRRDENDNGWKNVISEKNNLPLGMSDDEKELFNWLRNKEESRSNKVIIWYTEGLNLEKDIKLPKGFLGGKVYE
jgi:HD superfamily phosphohydrolase